MWRNCNLGFVSMKCSSPAKHHIFIWFKHCTRIGFTEVVAMRNDCVVPLDWEDGKKGVRNIKQTYETLKWPIDSPRNTLWLYHNYCSAKDTILIVGNTRAAHETLYMPTQGLRAFIESKGLYPPKRNHVAKKWENCHIKFAVVLLDQKIGYTQELS